MQRTWRRPVAIAAVVLVLAVSGLGAGFALNRDGNGATDGEQQARETTVVATGNRGFWLPLDRLTVPYPRPESIPEFQWAMLEDGWVTDEEALAARDATVACIAEAGLDVRPLEGDPAARRAPSFMVVTGQPGRPPGVDACKDEFMEFVGMGYGSQGDTRDWVTKAYVDGLFHDCLAERGFGVPAPGQTYEEFWTKERFGALIADRAGDAAFRECSGATGNVRWWGVTPEAPTEHSPFETCVAEHGYTVSALGQRPEEFWTPERLNSIPSVPGLATVWQKCSVVGMAARRTE
ncbi:MAG: hypothetical protein WD557_11070 [Dehalococcoidia bacterium]